MPTSGWRKPTSHISPRPIQKHELAGQPIIELEVAHHYLTEYQSNSSSSRILLNLEQMIRKQTQFIRIISSKKSARKFYKPFSFSYLWLWVVIPRTGIRNYEEKILFSERSTWQFLSFGGGRDCNLFDRQEITKLISSCFGAVDI